MIYSTYCSFACKNFGVHKDFSQMALGRWSCAILKILKPIYTNFYWCHASPEGTFSVPRHGVVRLFGQLQITSSSLANIQHMNESLHKQLGHIGLFIELNEYHTSVCWIEIQTKQYPNRSSRTSHFQLFYFEKSVILGKKKMKKEFWFVRIYAP